MENYSPLRYPGGKSALYPAIANIIESNNMKHCIYIEPFAGGANIAWSLLINGIVDYIIINDQLEDCIEKTHRLIQSQHAASSLQSEFICRIQKELKERKESKA